MVCEETFLKTSYYYRQKTAILTKKFVLEWTSTKNAVVRTPNMVSIRQIW